MPPPYSVLPRRLKHIRRPARRRSCPPPTARSRRVARRRVAPGGSPRIRAGRPAPAVCRARLRQLKLRWPVPVLAISGSTGANRSGGRHRGRAPRVTGARGPTRDASWRSGARRRQTVVSAEASAAAHPGFQGSRHDMSRRNQGEPHQDPRRGGRRVVRLLPVSDRSRRRERRPCEESTWPPLRSGDRAEASRQNTVSGGGPSRFAPEAQPLNRTPNPMTGPDHSVECRAPPLGGRFPKPGSTRGRRVRTGRVRSRPDQDCPCAG